MAQVKDYRVIRLHTLFMDRQAKFTVFAGVTAGTMLILSLVSARSFIFIEVLALLVLVLALYFKHPVGATTFALLNFILAVNVFDQVGLIIIGSM